MTTYDLVSCYFIVGIVVYWVKNKINPTNLLLEVAAWPWYAYKFFKGLFS